MVALWINNRAFLLGVRAPQQEDNPFAVLVNQAYHFIRKVSHPSWHESAPGLPVP